MQVDFRFNMDQQVKIIPLDVNGVVTMLGYDRGGKMCFVRYTTGGGWFYEDLLGDLKEDR